MEFRQLKYFIGIAETGSFSEASRRFFLSQSAISQQIKALEDELGMLLFVRTPHKVELTEAGQALLPLARKTIESLSECHERMSDINNMLCGELNIGLTFSLEPYIRNCLVRFLKTFPKVQLNVYYRTIPEVKEMLRKRSIDIAFCIDTLEDNEEFTREPVHSYKLCAIMRDTHPLASRKSLSFSDLELQSFILPEKGIRDRNAIEEYLSSKADSLKVRCIMNAPEAILNIVRESNFLAILADIAIKDDPTLKAIDITELSSPVQSYAFFLRNNYVKKSALRFLEMVKQEL